MAVDYRELNEVVLPTHVAVPDIVLILDTLGMVLGMCRAVLDLAKFFSVYPWPPNHKIKLP